MRSLRDALNDVPAALGLALSSMQLSTLPSLLVALILIAPIAVASPPDPSWIAGIYDGADGDDVVTLVYDTPGSTAAPPTHVPPLPGLTETSFASIVPRLPGGQCTRGPRSPPLPLPANRNKGDEPM